MCPTLVYERFFKSESLTPSRSLINIYVTDNCETIEESNDAKDNNDDDVDSFRDNLEGPKAKEAFANP